jgi:serine/threonine protein kinase
MSVCFVCGSSLELLDTICPTCGAHLVSLYLPSGTPLKGYEILEMLGQGGFGITYRAESGQKNVAIKEFFPEGSSRVQGRVIPPSTILVSEFVELQLKFLEEMRILKQFMLGQNHAGIVDVFETFEANGTTYLVMELLEGETLEARILKLGKLKAKEVREIADGLCDALRTVHKAGLLHRDIKPANVFLTADGRVVLIDFGSARAFKQGHTMRHTRMVTPNYAPLEQYSSEARVSPATDVYALSATLYHALTGVMPPTAIERLNGAVLMPLKANFSAGLRQAIEHGLSLQMADRPADAAAFAKLALQRNATVKTTAKTTVKPRPPVNSALQPDFWAYNPDFLAFLTFGFVLLGLWLILGWLPAIAFLEIVLIGVFQITLAILIAWGYTALLELPLRFWRGLQQPVSSVRRVLITGLAFLSAVFLIALFKGSAGRPDLFLWFLIGTIFTYALLLRAYRFPTRVTVFQRYHWWDGFWLVVISSLIAVFISGK